MRTDTRRFCITLVLAGVLSACSNYQIDSVNKWCEWIVEEDVLERETPFWALLPGYSLEADAIRADYAGHLNDMYMAELQDRTDRMVWLDGRELHMYSLSNFFMLDEQVFNDSWLKPLERAKRGDVDVRADPSQCMFTTATTFFDSVHIHHLEFDGLGNVVDKRETVFDSERAERAREEKRHTLTL